MYFYMSASLGYICFLLFGFLEDIGWWHKQYNLFKIEFSIHGVCKGNNNSVLKHNSLQNMYDLRCDWCCLYPTERRRNQDSSPVSLYGMAEPHLPVLQRDIGVQAENEGRRRIQATARQSYRGPLQVRLEITRIF